MKWFKSFQMSETTFNQINNLPENMRLMFYEAVCNYGINSIEPEFTGVELSVWIPMRDLIDYANERSRINSENGKKGGAPKGNNNRKQAKLTEINRNQPNVSEVMREAAAQGYYIDRRRAEEFLECNDLDPAWLNGPHSFLEFTAERIREKYEDKTDGEQKAIFISAVKEWDDLREEYPSWRAKKEKRDMDTARKAATAAAREKHPMACSKCGKELASREGAYYCFDCALICELNQETLEWEWRNW